MPSQRRMRVFALLFVLAVVTTLYMTGSARQTRSSDFYLKTQQELQTREYEKAAKLRDENDVSARLKAAEESAKHMVNQKNQKSHDSGDDSDSDSDSKNIAGRIALKEQGDNKKQVPGVATVGGRPRDREAAMTEETEEDHDAEVELNSILKKSPIIIFSKSYCPHSADAKRILLERYKIVPAPYVVELDLHPMGAKLQAMLGDTTGRRTVPNVLVIGKSIGGGDDIVELHQTNKLLNTLKSMGGSRIVEAELRRPDTRPEMRRRRV